MCGIVGYTGNRDILDVLIDSLKRLEYRGYDSWGVALNSKEINVFKKVGKIGDIDIKELRDILIADGYDDVKVGIAHTRWATNGKVCEINAHPHLSQKGLVAVVHNGIVENYFELKKELSKRGFKLISDCDSEIIPNLIEFYLKKDNYLEAVSKALKRIKGSYAVVIMFKGFDGLIAARNGSPLVIGVGKNNDFFVASDVPAFLKYTNRVVYLNDNELVLIKDGLHFCSVDKLKKINKEIKIFEWNLKNAEKGEFPHFILKEIYEQKYSIRRASEQDKRLLRSVAKIIKNSNKVFIIGCGTSYHACLSASYIFAKCCNFYLVPLLASELQNYVQLLDDNSLVIAISQSGETADVLDAVKIAKQRGAKVVSIVNVMGSSLTRLCDININMNAGPEISVLSTKTYTSQLSILLLLSYTLINKYKEGKKLLTKISSYVPRLLDKSSDFAKELAKKLRNKNNIFLIGRGFSFPIALEGALKIKEVSYIHAEGFAGAELKHGTIALIEEGVPVITITTEDTHDFITSNASEVKSRGAFVVGIGSKDSNIFDEFFKVEDFGFGNQIVLIIPLQLLAYYLAIERGLDPDKPRNLAKSVTVR